MMHARPFEHDDAGHDWEKPEEKADQAQVKIEVKRIRRIQIGKEQWAQRDEFLQPLLGLPYSRWKQLLAVV